MVTPPRFASRSARVFHFARRSCESTNHQADFLDAVLKRRDPVAPVEGGFVASYLGMLAESAGRLQRELRWDPAAEEFVGDADANRLLVRPMRGAWSL